jgi:LPXTG-motif cell wall-anchored protein
MNRTLKRVLGLTGSVMLGVAGAVTFASAAQAHHPTITGITECGQDGGWNVTWQVTDWEGTKDAVGTITAVEGEFNEGNEIVVGAVLPANDSGDHLVGSQDFAADVESATISVSAAWTNTAEGTTEGFVTAPDEDCSPETSPSPDPEPEPDAAYGYDADCVGIYVWAENYNEDALQEFTFESSDGEGVTATPEVDETFEHYFLMGDDSTSLTVDVYEGETLVETIEWEENVLCSYVSVEADCEGLIFTLTVPADGEAASFELWTSLSDEPILADLAPGESETHTFKAVADEELWVDYYVYTDKDQTSGGVLWIPCDEESPSPSETPSAQPQLPTTGSSLTIMIGSAAALIVAAAAIFLIMRRRRTAQDW